MAAVRPYLRMCLRDVIKIPHLPADADPERWAVLGMIGMISRHGRETAGWLSERPGQAGTSKATLGSFQVPRSDEGTLRRCPRHRSGWWLAVTGHAGANDGKKHIRGPRRCERDCSCEAAGRMRRARRPVHKEFELIQLSALTRPVPANDEVS
jgi:hypothetical protein